VHPLHDLLVAAAAGRFPPVDGSVEVMPPWRDDQGREHHAVVEFTGHAVILTDRSPGEVADRGADGFGGSTHTDVVRWLAGPHGWIGSHDAVLVASGTGGGSSRLVETDAHDQHPRVGRARRHREQVRVFADEAGFVTVGRGLVGRLELSMEVLGARGIGAGRRLVTDALGLIAPEETIWVQCAPGNAASLRLLLSCGFVPIGAEILLDPAVHTL
jgi:hypothetical protein